MNCKKCNKKFEVQKGLKNYCSLECRKEKVYNKDYKNKISESLKTFNQINSRKENNKKEYLKNPKQCLNCQTFISYENKINKFCNQSCATTFNNKKRGLKPRIKILNNKCESCNIPIKKGKYCSLTCQQKFYLEKRFKKIKEGDTSLKNANYKKYLIFKHGEKCMECNWNSINKKSGKIPIELEHIDGNSNNNSLDNLKLLCPNCHSLTPTYKSLNRGNGRFLRKKRYQEGKSF